MQLLLVYLALLPFFVHEAEVPFVLTREYFTTRPLQDGVLPFHQVAQLAASENTLRAEAEQEIRLINAIRSKIGRPLLEFTVENADVNEDLVNQLRTIRKQEEDLEQEWKTQQAQAAQAEGLWLKAEKTLTDLNELRSKRGKPPLNFGFQRGQVTQDTVEQIQQEMESELKEEKK